MSELESWKEKVSKLREYRSLKAAGTGYATRGAGHRLLCRVDGPLCGRRLAAFGTRRRCATAGGERIPTATPRASTRFTGSSKGRSSPRTSARRRWGRRSRRHGQERSAENIFNAYVAYLRQSATLCGKGLSTGKGRRVWGLNDDSSNHLLDIAIPTLGGIKQKGYRKTRVDGWGTITTPYYTTPVNCIRVRSEIHEIDSVSLFPIAFPRNTVEYKWLVNGDHYPALWVTSNLLPGGTETISNIRYRDNPLAVIDTAIDTAAGVPVVARNMVSLRAWPNPATSGTVTLELPSGWKIFSAELFDMNSRSVGVFNNQRELNIRFLPAGQYLCRVISGGNEGYVMITKDN